MRFFSICFTITGVKNCWLYGGLLYQGSSVVATCFMVLGGFHLCCKHKQRNFRQYKHKGKKKENFDPCSRADSCIYTVEMRTFKNACFVLAFLVTPAVE